MANRLHCTLHSSNCSSQPSGKTGTTTTTAMDRGESWGTRDCSSVEVDDAAREHVAAGCRADRQCRASGSAAGPGPHAVGRNMDVPWRHHDLPQQHYQHSKPRTIPTLQSSQTLTGQLIARWPTSLRCCWLCMAQAASVFLASESSTMLEEMTACNDCRAVRKSQYCRDNGQDGEGRDGKRMGVGVLCR
nr:hypothetical protein CFP56_09387 [Quercus suber]